MKGVDRMKILKFIFFIPYFVIGKILDILNIIFAIAALLWSALGVRMGLTNAAINTGTTEEKIQMINDITNFVNGEGNQND